MENNNQYSEKETTENVEKTEVKSGDNVVREFLSFLKGKDFPTKDRRVSLFVLIFTLVISILLAALITFMSTTAILDRRYKAKYNEFVSKNVQSDYYTLETVKAYFAKYYIGDISSLTDEEITDALIRAYIAKTGDKYGYYWNAKEYEEYIQQVNGDAVGLGILMGWDEENTAINVFFVYSDSPADKAGVKSGDRIVAIGGEKISDIGYDKAIEKAKGKKGSKVTLGILRDGEEFSLTVTRDDFKTMSVMSNMLSDEKTALIRILEFDATTVEQLATQYLEMKNSGAEHFVFDLRDNPGGQLDSVVGVLSFMLGDGVPVLEAADKSGEKTVIETDRAYYCTDKVSSGVDKEFKHAGKTVILTNEFTASAAELFTAAMHHNNADVITVGMTTYGKGVMQSLYPLPNGGVIKITYSTYTAPGVASYDGVGLSPDVVCEMSEEHRDKNILILTEDEDTQIQKALGVLYGQTVE
ncbi:MAG: PDZ domain-containing protein [Clostridia bacterium]|nr:PDZ domain-containing protein [Clostridia bacterium]